MPNILFSFFYLSTKVAGGGECRTDGEIAESVSRMWTAKMENSQNTNFNGFREREKGNRPVVTIWLGITPRSVKTELFSQKNNLKH
jgi:hypothetical protein